MEEVTGSYSELGSLIGAISDAIDHSYPAGLSAEAWLWRRCAKVAEEAGEVIEALLGYHGENPRKGVTHTHDDLVGELLDTALAALGAVAHCRPIDNPIELLAEHSRRVEARLQEALR